MHNPRCESWELHVERAYAALTDGDDYDLNVFTDFLIDSYASERIAADPESAAWFESRREEAVEFPFATPQEWDNHPRFKDRVA